MNTEPRPTREHAGLLRRLGWLPVPLLLAAIIVTRAAGLRGTYELTTVRLVLSFIFYTLVSLGTLFLIGRSFLASGSPGLLLLECGVVLWSLAGTVGDLAGPSRSPSDQNINVTIFNIVILLAGLCHLAGVMLSRRQQWTLLHRAFWLVVGCGLALGAIGLVAWAAVGGWLPVFFVPGPGGTPVRYGVLTSATAAFTISAVLLLARRRGERTPFTSWYALAMLLLGVGLLGITIQLSLWSVVNWLSRTAQWMGGFYLLLAAIASVRQTGAWDINLEASEWAKRRVVWEDRLLWVLTPRHIWSLPLVWRLAVAVGLAVAATALRWSMIPWFGTGAPYTMALLAVIATVILAGFWAGLLAVLISDLGVELFVITASPEMSAESTAARLGMAVSIGALLCVVFHALRAAQLRWRDREERFRAAFDDGAVGMAMTDLDMRLTRVNAAFCRMLGYQERELVGRSVADITHPDDLAPNMVELQRVLRGQSDRVSMEKRYLRKDGTTAWGLMSTAAVRDEQGRPAYLVTHIQDITERKKREKAVALDEVFGSAPTFLHVLRGPEFVFEYANEAYYRLVGQRELIGRPAFEALPETARQGFEARLAQVLSTRQPFIGRELAVMLARTPGAAPEERFVDLYYAPLVEADGSCNRVLGHGVDVTEQVRERKRAEAALRETTQRFQTIMDHAPIAIYVKNRDGRFVFGNRKLEHYTGLPLERLLGMADYDFAAKEEADRWRENDLKVLAGQQAEYEETGTDRDGCPYVNISVKFPLSDRSGTAVEICGISMDITDRKRAEEALRLSEETLSKTFQSTAAAMALTRIEDGRILDVNDRWAQLMEYSRDEVIGKTATEYTGWKDLADRAAMVREVRTHGFVRDRECAVRSRHGREWTALMSAQTVTIRGEPVLITSAIDITDRKRAEEALRQNEARLAQMIEVAPAFMCVLRGPRLVYELVNERYYEAVGRRELIGRPLLEAMPEIADQPFPGILERVMRTGEPYRDSEALIRLRRAPGGALEERWLDFVYLPLRGGDGTVDGVFVHGVDITERKQAETALRRFNEQLEQRVAERTAELARAGEKVQAERQRLFDVLETLPAMICLLTPDYHVAFANRSFREKFGEANGRHCYEYCFSRSEPCAFCESFGVLKTGQSHHWEAIAPDGTVIAAHDYPFADVDGSPLILEMDLDITAHRRAEAALRELNETLERRVTERTTELARAKAVAESASKAKDQFIAVLSHELRTPLTPAVAAMSLLMSDVRLPADVREDLEMISRNLNLEVRLIADLLDVSRIISGKLHLEKRPTDVAAAIREAAKIVTSDLDAKGQTLRIETPGVPYLTFADAARLQQVFWNLLRNSIKFSPARSRIEVRARLASADRCPLVSNPCTVGMGECPLPLAGNGNGEPRGENLIVEVIDQGTGIDPAMLPRLFNAFEQEQKARSFGGLGLGLSICKAVVEMHGGTVSARSDGVGCGATFTVRLPVAQCPLRPASAPAPRDGASKECAAAQDRNRPLRILVIEDHADTAKIMRRLLKAEGHEVTVAGSVSEGLACVRQSRPDILVSDLGLPDASGLDLMRELVASGEGIPAIALSGYGTQADIEQSAAAGFAEHLVKPLHDVGLLTAAIARLVALMAGNG